MSGSPAGRVLALLERVQERPGLTATTLADELGVGERTVRRYVTTLQELGIPVAADRGRLGGYRLAPGYRMPPLMLGTDEAVAITLILAVLGGDQNDRGGGPTPSDVALGKLRRALPRDVADRVDDVLAVVSPPSRGRGLSPEATAHPARLATLAGAVVGQRVCRVRHRTDDTTATVRKVNPYGVAVVRGHLYLHGWCHLRRARRTFRVDRIEQVEVLEERFRAPHGLDVAAAVERSLATSWSGWQVNVVLDGPRAEVESWIPRYVGVAETIDEHTTRLRLTTRNLETTVLRLSDHPFVMRVEEPAELREAFERRGRWMLATAGAGASAGGLSDRA